MGAQCSCAEDGFVGEALEAVQEEPPQVLMDEYEPCVTAKGPSMKSPMKPSLPVHIEDSAFDADRFVAPVVVGLASRDEAPTADVVTHIPSGASSYLVNDDGSDDRAQTRRTWEASDMEEAVGSSGRQGPPEDPVTLPHLLRSSSAARRSAETALAFDPCQKSPAVVPALVQPARFRVLVERACVDDYLGADVRSSAGGKWEIVHLDAAGLCARTELLRAGDIIHSVNGVDGSDHMIKECFETAGLVLEVSRPCSAIDVYAAPRRNVRPKVPPLKLPPHAP